jgi:hypothetical protein
VRPASCARASRTASRPAPFPELHFAYDESVERGVRLSKLIDEAVAPRAAAQGRRTARRRTD